MRPSSGYILRTLAAVMVVGCLASVDVYGQARGGGRISTREDINRAAGGGGLQDIATNQAQGGGGMAIGGGGAAGGGGALAVEGGSAAGAGGGLAVKTKGPGAGGAGAGGDLLTDEAKSTKGGGIAAEDEGSMVRSLATWVPIIAVVAFGLTAFFLRYMKGKSV